jgi:hypothetical protein
VRGTDQAYIGNIAGDSREQHNIRIYGSRVLAYGNDPHQPAGRKFAGDAAL